MLQTKMAVFFQPTSDTGTNLKMVGGSHFCRALHFFGSKSTIYSRFGERFRDGQYSLVSIVFFAVLLALPLCPMKSAPVQPTNQLINRRCADI